MRKLILSILTVLAGGVFTALAQELPLYLDKSQPAEVRARDIVSRLTLEEKAFLMKFESPAIERLNIPEYNWWNEALHGVARQGEATVYPMPIGMAASFDTEAIHSVFTSVSDEARVKNRIARAEGRGSYQYEGLTFWTPNINIFRDPRWGRGMETYGEDPYLTGVLGGAVVDGLQGEVTAESIKTQACAKHFAVHSGPEWSRHSYDANVSDRDLYETYLPAFKDLIVKHKVEEVMFAYNSFQGKPCGANERLLKEILRDEWGYKGIILSDCGAVNDFYEPWAHNYVPTPAEAAAACVKAGGELECGSVFVHLIEAVQQGLISEDELTEPLVHLFTDRIRLGDIDNESPYDDIPMSVLCSEEHRLQALEMARETMVLLMNRDNILPLAADAKVALVGPNAADETMMWGNYNGFPTHNVTLLSALQERIPNLIYNKGCELVIDEEIDAKIASVLEAVADAEIVIFAGGISPQVEGEEMPVKLPGFRGGDRESLELPQVQRDMIAALHAAGKKVILVNFSGSAIALVPETETCDAILQAWYPGQEGGTAVADVLFGDYNPSGKLPLTFYRSVDQLPDFENYDMAGHTYRYFKGEPLFAFGYGLSYTNFEYVKAKVRFGRLVVKVRNTGDRDGCETVQMYVRRPDDANGPLKTLRGFKKVNIKAGKTAKVVIRLDDETFNWWSEESGRVAPLKGRYEILVGPSSADKDLTVIPCKYRG